MSNVIAPIDYLPEQREADVDEQVGAAARHHPGAQGRD